MVKKIGKQIGCNWVNESISEEAIILLDKINLNHKQFITEFKTLIGRYRSYKEFTNTAPMPKETIEHLTKILRQIEVLKESIELVPSDAHAWNTEAIFMNFKNHKAFEFLIDHKMIELLNYYSFVIRYSKEKILSYPNQKGRNKNWQENKIIFETFILLKKYLKTDYKIKDLYQFISDFLILNGVHVPIEAENIGKIINRIQKLRNST